MNAAILAYQRAYTLLELMTVMAIIGILSSIAIPQYRDYKKRAYDERARADLMTAVVAEEAYYVDAEHYLSCTDSACHLLPGIRALSPGVTLVVQATTSGFVAQARATQGSGHSFHWDSADGVLR